MIDPMLGVQTALHDHLIATPEVTALVEPINIRVGTSRPENLPAVMIANGITTMHGHAAGSQYVASVMLDLHVWAIEDGLDRAKAIGAAVAHALIDWPAGAGFAFDHFKHVRTVWPRDPDPTYGHGVLSIEAFIRWSI